MKDVKPGSERDRILQVMQDLEKGGPKDVMERAEQMGVELDYDSVRARMPDMAKEDLLQKVGRGLYTLPSDEDTGRAQSEDFPRANGESDDLVSLLKSQTTMTIYTGVHAAAGNGRISYPDEKTHRVDLPAGLLAEVIGFRPPSRIGIMWADGDSMEPTIYDEEMVIYKPIEEIQASGVYVVHTLHGLIVKRIQPHLDGSLTVISDNDSKSYGNEDLIPDDSGDPSAFTRESTGRGVRLRAVGKVLFPNRDTDTLHINQVTRLIQGIIRGDEEKAKAIAR